MAFSPSPSEKRSSVVFKALGGRPIPNIDHTIFAPTAPPELTTLSDEAEWSSPTERDSLVWLDLLEAYGRTACSELTAQASNSKASLGGGAT